MERALYRSLLRSASTRQRNLQKLRDAEVPRALSKLCDAAGAIASPSESAEVGAELAAAVRNLPSFDDLESTCKWTRYQLRAHNDSPRAACRARFTETAKELAMIRAMADDSAVQGSTNSNPDSHMETGHAGADAEFREWAEALPDPRVTKLLLSMRYAEESERVDQGFEGLRLLDELNAHVGRLMAVLGISSGDETVAAGVYSDDGGADSDPVGAWLRYFISSKNRDYPLPCARPRGCSPRRASRKPAQVAAGAPEFVDLRAETAKPDTHLKTWESKKAASPTDAN